jgi:hypothetical protein
MSDDHQNYVLWTNEELIELINSLEVDNPDISELIEENHRLREENKKLCAFNDEKIEELNDIYFNGCKKCRDYQRQANASHRISVELYEKKSNFDTRMRDASRILNGAYYEVDFNKKKD